jgi:hypothetical protein
MKYKYASTNNTATAAAATTTTPPPFLRIRNIPVENSFFGRGNWSNLCF